VTDDLVARVAEAISRASRVTVLTGAGVSAASGIPTFRGADGMWKKFRAETLATAEAFKHDPTLVWEWYDWRRCLISNAEPNAGHRALAELERRKPAFTLVTQNVDGLHDRAGSRSLVKLHGDIWCVRCTACGREQKDDRAPLAVLPPQCDCGGLLRPAVVWFGEPLPAETWREAEQAASDAELFLVIGTSAEVYPAAALPYAAKAAGAVVVEINPQPTPLTTAADVTIRATAGLAVPALLRAAWP